MCSIQQSGVSNDATVWLSPITTDENGKAKAEVVLPSSAGQWSFAVKGCTTNTLVGQADAKVITRKDFLVELRTPDKLQEGDTMSFLATVHNLTDFEGEAAITLKISGASQPFSATKTVRVKKQSTTDVVFEGYTIPFAESLKIELVGKADTYDDSFVSDLQVRPWGIEYADHSGGTTSTEAGATLARPKDQKFTGRKLHVTLSPSIEQAIIDLALERGIPLQGANCSFFPNPQTPGSALLAATSALNYARSRGASNREIESLSTKD